MWLWNRDSEFTKWQHPAMWYVALRWHAIEFAQTSTILEFYIWFRFPPHHRSRHVILHQPPNFFPNWTTLCKKITSCRFSRWRISAILDFRDPIMGSLKAHLQLTELLSFPENRVSWILASTSKMAAAVNNSSYHRTIPALWLVFTAFNSLIRFKLQVWQKQVFAGRNPTLLSNNNNKWRW